MHNENKIRDGVERSCKIIASNNSNSIQEEHCQTINQLFVDDPKKKAICSKSPRIPQSSCLLH